MSLRLTVHDPSRGSDPTRSYLMRVDDATTVGEVAEALAVEPALLAPDGDARSGLAAAGILNGAELPPARRDPLPPGTPRLEVVAGPFAGETFPLAPGATLQIGSARDADLCIADPFLAERHATLEFGELSAPAPGRPAALEAVLTPLDEEALVVVNGERVTDATRLVPADLWQLGSSLFRIGLEPASDADIALDQLGMRGYNRPSRIRPTQPQPVITLPGDKPHDQDRSPLPWLSAVIPVVLGVTMAVVFGRPIMLLMAAASPIMVIGSFMTNRRLAKRKGERTEAEWIDDVRRAEKKLAALVREQRLDLWYRHPDPVVIRDIALRPLSRLWERRNSDGDALMVRVGVTEVPLDVRFEGGSSKDRADRRVGVAPAPVAADLARGPLGIAGPLDVVRSVAREAVCSLATLRSPRDLQIIVLCDETDVGEWWWVQWLPHTQPGEHLVSFVGNTDDTRRERVRELTTLLEARARAAGDRGGRFDTDVVVVVDGARRYRTLPGMVPLLDRGRRYGIHVIALDSDRSRLPEETATAVAVDATDTSLARFESADEYHPGVLLDGLSLPNAEQIARALCSIEHVSGIGDEGMLPTSVRYTDLLGIDTDDPGAVVRRWETTPRRTFVVVGANADGEFALDIASDGPHALVAGTTGSGKSEFLQALVVSLALANRPDALNFVLVDYKGGSAFADCERLPHTVGMVTNLDARETERALASLDAELKRRERVLRELGAKDLDAAWSKDPEASARLGLARLMIVIDEFAELKTELPEFINGLVRIARVGRSLGVNLVLATQRPSGVVTPEMQSNINLRVALRVTDRGDSNDVLGSHEAALIGANTPGRGYVRTGVGTAPVPFQTARVAGLRQGAARARATLPPKAPIEWETLGLPPRFPAKQQTAAVRADHDDTDLRALVNLVIAAAHAMGIERNASPWLLPLPPLLTLDRLATEEVPPTTLVLGLEDVPSEQRQRVRGWDVVGDGHLLVLGGALSGRTTALRTLLAQAVQKFTPADLHLYVADYGNGALLPFADAPHCGAVVTPLEQERLPRLMGRLLEELSRRQGILSRAGVGNIAEQRRLAAPADALPYAIVAVDGWERLTSTLNADQLVAFRDQFVRVLREGPAVGIRVLLTGDRGIGGDKVAGFIDAQYVLPLRDVNDYRAAGVMVREVPDDLPPGRALFGAAGTELQFAIVSRDTSGEAQTAALRALIEDVSTHYEGFPQLAELPRPFRVDPLPSYIALSAAYELPLDPACTAPSPIVGVGGDELSRITVDWQQAPGFVVAGVRGSGRSSALAAIAHQLAWAGAPLLVVAPRESVLTEVAASHGATVVSAPDTDAMTLLGILDRVPDALGRRVTVVIDDADLLKQTPLEQALSGVTGQVDLCVAVETEAASTLFSGPFVTAKKARQGLVLSPTNAMTGTQLMGAQIPRFMLGSGTPGSAVLFRDAAWLPVRVPDVRQ
ncbi:FtsK/SpoIIIE domain-containing protein [Herbiconiux sp. SYSU D00978]|uniref:FtsK/SpoIIIE domain-containing protein n=1 Tax=Herbiconiux sp. SYSU D00978 TaxID=2812562 RepID=UPI001A978A17|nr:FtsK/SpoIIIE domain-containing protein [Herbiconiux sp. SYSU D00978]